MQSVLGWHILFSEGIIRANGMKRTLVDLKGVYLGIRSSGIEP
jgi:hypothetical protein